MIFLDTNVVIDLLDRKRECHNQALMLLSKDDAQFAPRALAEMRTAYAEAPSPMLRDLILRYRAKFKLP